MQQGQIISLDVSLALQAAKVSVDHRLPMADSIILTTAQANQAILWTQDADFDGLPDVQYKAKNTIP
jgi:toxin FitB